MVVTRIVYYENTVPIQIYIHMHIQLEDIA